MGGIAPKCLYISIYIDKFVRKISVKEGKLYLSDDIKLIYEKTITKFGTGAKIDAPKEFIGKKVYILIRS